MKRIIIAILAIAFSSPCAMADTQVKLNFPTAWVQPLLDYYNDEYKVCDLEDGTEPRHYSRVWVWDNEPEGIGHWTTVENYGAGAWAKRCLIMELGKKVSEYYNETVERPRAEAAGSYSPVGINDVGITEIP